MGEELHQVIVEPRWKVGRAEHPRGGQLVAVVIPYLRLVGIPAVGLPPLEALRIARLLIESAEWALAGVPIGADPRDGVVVPEPRGPIA